ncbi:ATP-binding cassette domain-containing protein [Kibdelosporangium philippinense]|uniref:ATP-binding cassette domain-containing protein n=1 Tax=Kibdelosporangium philippinense TaxID=211113 RepID=A0ABS8ZT45_9PSEU|nr:ATP-binding cassette domain-containing protein [Kibdelosporangium philippinense]MCE7010165.1 ATP-binding cassette domain-containing protein [Kibdelosporangium philippinense]
MINAEGLTKRYAGGVGIADLSFQVRPGVVTGFLGPNGAGKSTTIKLMLGVIHGEGRTTFNGIEYKHLPDPLRTVGVLVDPGAVHPARTAAGHLRMVAAGGGISAKRVHAVLSTVGLESVANKAVGKFSLGMRQRLGLATALLGDPEYLILDEPANGLDPEGVLWIRHFLKRLAAEGRTVLASSHLLAEMSQLADELVVIAAGKLVAAEPLAQFVRQYTRGEVVVRSAQITPLMVTLGQAGLRVRQEVDELVVDTDDSDVVATVAAKAGIPIRELFVRRSGLEAAFMAATADSVQHKGIWES